jgi:mRNA-degrading endonuclease HigB of HigAB toxin-antitoxin module
LTKSPDQGEWRWGVFEAKMNVISRKRLEEFWEEYPGSEAPLKSWFNTCRKARWKNFDEVQEVYPDKGKWKDDC